MNPQKGSAGIPLARATVPLDLFRRAAPWVGLIGLGLLVAASFALERQMLPPWAIGALVAGVLIWIVIARVDLPGREELGALDPPARGPRLLPLLLAAVGVALCWWKMPSREFRLPGLLFWLTGIAAWLWAWWPPRVPRATSPPSGDSVWAPRAGLAALLVVGIFFSFYRLADVPANPVSDHASEMLDMFDLLHGPHPIFFLRNDGVAPAHFYWTCAFVAGLKLPLHYLTVKIATSFIGLLGVVIIYLAGRELGGAWLGLAAAAFMAWGKWPFSLGRQGMEYVYAVPPTIFVIWALLRYMRRGDRVSALAAGIGVGAGLYTYPSFRVVPLLVPLALAAALFDRRRRGTRWRLFGHGFLAAATAALVFLPLGKFMLVDQYRGYFWSRSLTRLTETETAVPGSRIRIFAGNLWNMLRAFHWRGSSTWTVLPSNDPFLDIVFGGLLFAGLGLLAVLAVKGAWRWTWLIPAFFVLTLPSTLSLAFPNENPSLNRAGPAIAVVGLIASLPLAYLCASFWRRHGGLRVAGCFILAGVCALSIQQNYRTYFVTFADSYEQLIPHTLKIAETLKKYRIQGIPYSQCYLLAVPNWLDARNIAFQIDDPTWPDTHIVLEGVLPGDLRERPLLFLYNLNDKQRLEKLRRIYPGNAQIVHQRYPERDFGVYVAQ